MKKIFIISAILIAQVHAFAIIDTLRYYDPVVAKRGFSWSSAAYPTQLACFEPPASGSIQSLVVMLGGVTGSVTLHFYGHEGGNALPQFENDLVDSIVINKTATGVQKIVVDLPVPIRIDKNLFFIKFDNFSRNLQLITDTIIGAPFCTSPSGGDYHRQYVYGISNAYYSDANYAIDLIIDYPDGKVSPQYLKDITAEAGIDTKLGNSSVAWADINNDHNLDLLVLGKLYKNMGDGTFTDITTTAGLNTPASATTFVDMNNDGKDDILFLHSDSTKSALYVNNGDETFTQYPLRLNNFPAGIQGVAIADYNNDSYPDLFIGQIWTSVTLQDSAKTYIEKYYPHHLYMNDKNLGFVDKSSSMVPFFYDQPSLIMPSDSVLASQNLIGTSRCVRGAQWVDYNDDGQMDLYVANYRLQPDELWQNNGDGTFTDIAQAKKIDVNNYGYSGHATGVDWADFDNDGDMDLLLPQLAHPRYIMYDHRPTTIYQNSGAPSYNFTDLNPGVNQGLGIEYEETHAGATWGDLDNDGLLDFAISAFYGCRYSDIYIQKPDHTFEMKSFVYGIRDVSSDADLTLVDYNNDGKLDYAGGSNAGKFTLFKNQIPSWNTYVELDLVSTSGNKNAVGAKVTVYAGGKKHTAYQMPYHGAKMSKGNRMHFGLNAPKIDSVVVRWPNGTTKTETFTGVAINNFNVLTEGGNVFVGVKEDKAPLISMNVYPNPATTTVNFEYELTSAASVTLNVYSVLGEKISILNNEAQSVGKQNVQWNVKSNIAPGVYTYRLIINNSEMSLSSDKGQLQKTGVLVVH